MTAPAGSNLTRAVWITLIQDRLEQLHKVRPFTETVPSELAFRKEFWKLPDDLNVPSGDRNYAYFIHRHKQMESIVRGLDKALSLSSPNSLSDVFWTHALAALQVSPLLLSCDRLTDRNRQQWTMTFAFTILPIYISG